MVGEGDLVIRIRAAHPLSTFGSTICIMRNLKYLGIILNILKYWGCIPPYPCVGTHYSNDDCYLLTSLQMVAKRSLAFKRAATCHVANKGMVLEEKAVS